MSDLSTGIDKILTENLPQALEQLSKRNESYQKVASHLETEYISARRSGVEDQTNNVLKESKQYLTQSLIHLVNDLGIISDQFDQLLSLQDHALDSLANQTELLQSRIATSKNQKIYSTLEEMQAPYRSEVANPPLREIPISEISMPAHLRGVQLNRK